jgi:hypothetical protein
MGIHCAPIAGEGYRWRRRDEDGVFFNMRNYHLGERFDAACSMRVVSLPDPVASYQIVKLDPYVTLYKGQSIVHHMDIFLCDERMEVPDDQDCLSSGSWQHASGPCSAMAWAYDKGALAPHELPADAGIRVGAGTPHTKLALQVHYLLPSDGAIGQLSASDLRHAGYRDSSGIIVTLWPAVRRRNGLTTHNLTCMPPPPHAGAAARRDDLPVHGAGEPSIASWRMRVEHSRAYGPRCAALRCAALRCAVRFAA